MPKHSHQEHDLKFIQLSVANTLIEIDQVGAILKHSPR